MLMGAIIGAVVAMVAVLVVILRNSSRLKKITTPLGAGDRTAARAAIDQMLPRNDHIKNPRAAIRARERLAALAIIGDRAALVAEVAAIDGPELQATYARNIGYLALIAVGERPAENLLAFEALVRAAEAAKHRKVALDVLRAQLAVARALTGTPADDKALRTFKSGHLDKGILEHFAKQCLERVGRGSVAAAAA